MSRNVFLFLSKEATEEKRLISTPVRVNLNKKTFSQEDKVSISTNKIRSNNALRKKLYEENKCPSRFFTGIGYYSFKKYSIYILLPMR
jgi:hypothetical protein